MQDDAAKSSTEQEPVEKKRGLCAYVHSCGFINVYITTAMYRRRSNYASLKK